MRSKCSLSILFALLLVPAPLLRATPGSPDGSQSSAAPPVPTDVPATSQRYTLLLSGNVAGVYATWKTPDEKIHGFFQFNDRGRGPVQRTEVGLDKTGTLQFLSISGVDYFKAPVEENFTVVEGKAKWKNQAEKGEKPLSSPAFYVGLNGSFLDQTLLARALLQAGGKLPLLPEGEARIHLERELTVHAHAQSQQATIYSISGLDLTPIYICLDQDRNFFAGGSDWFEAIREGWEAAWPQIAQAENEITAQRAGTLATKLAHRPKGPLVVRDVAVADVENGKLVPHQDIFISANKIEAIAPTGTRPSPSGSEIIEGAGKTAIPGLWDMHAHVSDNDGLLNLAAGITTVRDMGNNFDTLEARRKRIEAGQEVGTRILPAGFIDERGPYQGPTGILVSNEAEAHAAVAKYANAGYIQVKLYSSLAPELVAVIAKDAHQRGMRVSGHIPAGMSAAECVRLGYDEIQHVNFLFLNFMPEVKDTRTPARFTAVAAGASDIDVNSAAVRDFIHLLKEHHTTLDPTLSIFESMFTDRPGEVPAGMAPAYERLPSQTRRGFLSGGLAVPDGMDGKYRKSFANALVLIHAMYVAGVPIEAGTDAFAGFSLHRELELDVQAGIPPPEVLKLATLGAARIMRRDSELGSLAAGKLADLVLVGGNPMIDISSLRKPSLVIKDGVIYHPQELDQELGIKP